MALYFVPCFTVPAHGAARQQSFPRRGGMATARAKPILLMGMEAFQTGSPTQGSRRCHFLPADKCQRPANVNVEAGRMIT